MTPSYVTVPQWYLGCRSTADLPRYALYSSVPRIPTPGHVTYQVMEHGALREIASDIDTGD
jgi:hypothetical protein